MVLALPGVPVTDNICGTLNPVGCDVPEINEYDQESICFKVSLCKLTGTLSTRVDTNRHEVLK